MATGRFYYFNPRSEIAAVPGGVRIKSPLRGVGLQHFELSGEQVPELLRFWRRNKRSAKIHSSHIPSGIFSELLISGILIPKSQVPKQVHLRCRGVKSVQQAVRQHLRALIRSDSQYVSRARHQIRENGFTILPTFIPANLASGLERYFQDRIREGYMSYGDDIVPKRHVERNEELSRELQKQFKRFVESAIGCPLKQTDNYISVYSPGAELPPHRDARAAEITISIQLTALAKPWPLCLSASNRKAPVRLSLQNRGDALIFLGHKLLHSRGRLRSRRSCTQLLLHYVRA